MVNSNSNVGKLRNCVLMFSFAFFSRWPQKIMEFDMLMKYFIFLTMFFFYPKSFVSCPKMVLPLVYMVLVEFY